MHAKIPAFIVKHHLPPAGWVFFIAKQTGVFSILTMSARLILTTVAAVIALAMTSCCCLF